MQAMEGEPLIVPGNGKQVRDLLFIDDLVEALVLAMKHNSQMSGRAFNLGGGPANSASTLEQIACISEMQGEHPTIRFESEQGNSPRYYVSDIRRFQMITGWTPRVGIREGMCAYYQWLIEKLVPKQRALRVGEAIV